LLSIKQQTNENTTPRGIFGGGLSETMANSQQPAAPSLGVLRL
jgi:hypothetical protein